MSKKEFDNPVITSVRVEAKDLELAKALGIKCSSALRAGIRNMAEGYFETLKDVPQELGELLTDLQRRVYEESAVRFRSEEVSRRIIQEELVVRGRIKTDEERKQDEQNARAEKLYVYDSGEDCRKYITREQYENDPESYKILPKPEQEGF